MTQATADLTAYMTKLGKQARTASRKLSSATTQQKNKALLAIADDLQLQRQTLATENAKDLQAGKEKGLSDALLDRLALTEARIDSMIEGLRQVATLNDPIGEIFNMKYVPSGLQIGQMRVPLGVVGIIYESRPNVTADAAALCLKSGNAAVLRGGSEAFYSNQAIAKSIKTGLEQAKLPAESIQILNTTDREAVGKMITMPEYIDVIIPRGGKGLIERISNEARVPVIKHLDGICHIYIDSQADITKAFEVTMNSKTQRYGTCNTLETLLVDQEIAADILPQLGTALIEKGVEIRACVNSLSLLDESAKKATDEDWDTEYLAPILSIKIVNGLDQAIEHINQHSSQHTDSIITENYTKARQFLQEIDSSSVMVNASTRFSDGFEYGLGAEIGISTDKFHARGPVGLEGLTSVKFIVLGDGHIRV